MVSVVEEQAESVAPVLGLMRLPGFDRQLATNLVGNAGRIP